MRIRFLRIIAPLASLFAAPGALQAKLPPGVQAMIEAAIASGDSAKVDTVLTLARSTHPADVADIDRIAAEWTERQAAALLKGQGEEREAIRSAGIFERWEGEGELGAFLSTGNTDSTGISAALSLDRTGLDWSHLLRARADYQESGGVTSREQFFFSYEPRYQMRDNLFAYGLAQWERDRLQGFGRRYAVSGGLGYKLVDQGGLVLAVKAGPAYRVTDYVSAPDESSLAGLAAFDFDWKIAERLTLSQDAKMVAETGGAATLIVDGTNTSLNLVTGLDAKVSDRLSTRLSYAVAYNSNPPTGAVPTDTSTRVSVVYDF